MGTTLMVAAMWLITRSAGQLIKLKGLSPGLLATIVDGELDQTG